VLARLAVPARTRWEKYMTTAVDQYQSELFRTLAAEHEARGEAKGKAEGKAKGKAEGKAEGEATAVLTVLDTRGVPVPDAVRERILACADLAQLETWLRRAVTATTAADVVHG
jgi:predicted transposase YdaD